jgi:hypothetical protein
VLVATLQYKELVAPEYMLAATCLTIYFCTKALAAKGNTTTLKNMKELRNFTK